MKVLVRHLITFLQEDFSPDAEIHLDKDGWMKDDLPAGDAIELIRQRGVFVKFQDDLFINN